MTGYLWSGKVSIWVPESQDELNCKKSGFKGSKSGFYHFFGRSQDYKGHSQEKSGISNCLAQLRQLKYCVKSD